MIRAIAATVLALGLAGPVLADHGHDRWDRHDQGRREWRDNRYDRHNERDWRDHRYYAPRYERRWRAPPPRGWYPGWREPYRRGYRYWNDGYYYSSPELGFSVVVPLR